MDVFFNKNSSMDAHTNKERIKRIEEIREAGVEPFGVPLQRKRIMIQEAKSWIDNGVDSMTKGISLCGRVIAKSISNSADAPTSYTLTIQDSTGKIRALLTRSSFSGTEWKIIRLIDIYDHVNVIGSIKADGVDTYRFTVEDISFLGKNSGSIRSINLEDPTNVYDQRYIVLLHNSQVRRNLRKRFELLSVIRQILDNKRYTEIETPIILKSESASAEHSLRIERHYPCMNQCLRSDLSVSLRKMLVSGMDRVFEIGKVFHDDETTKDSLSEHTVLEIYEAYADLNSMKDLLDNLIFHVISAIKNSMISAFLYGDRDPSLIYKDRKPFRSIDFNDIFLDLVGCSFLGTDVVAKKMKEFGIPNNDNHWENVKVLFGTRIAPCLRMPTFITKVPKQVEPLLRPDPTSDHASLGFWFYLYGQKIASGFTPENDPDIYTFSAYTMARQRAMKKWRHHVRRNIGIDKGSKNRYIDTWTESAIDEDYIQCLRIGLPFCSGLRISIDRLVKIVLASDSIRDVTALPDGQEKPRCYSKLDVLSS